jgi:5'-deoxynucleotidase YfbR-like HD superfamily hydrolase
LKNLIRKGWIQWNVNRERVESVAEHIYGVEALAIAMASEYNYDLDLYKVILMIAIHELEEIYIGDLTAWEISKEEKVRLGHEAIKKVLGELLIKDELESLILEFDERETKEAKFAYHCDKLESIPLLDFSSVISSVADLSFTFDACKLLKNLGGFKNLKVGFSLADSPLLTYQSVLNVINNVYNFRANGSTTTRTLKLHSDVYALLSDDDFVLANNKGWVISK